MRPWTAAVLTVAAVTGLGFVHPFGDPRVEPAEGLGTRISKRMYKPQPHCCGYGQYGCGPRTH